MHFHNQLNLIKVDFPFFLSFLIGLPTNFFDPFTSKKSSAN